MTRHTFYSFIVLLPEGIAAKKGCSFSISFVDKERSLLCYQETADSSCLEDF